MKENKGLNRLTGEFCNIIVEHARGSYTNEVDIYDSDRCCAELAKQVAIAYSAKVGYMSLYPELNDEKWNGLFDSKTAYSTILNNFNEFISDYKF